MKTLFYIALTFSFSFNLSAQWVEQENGTDENLCRVFFLDENNGWTIGLDGWYTVSGLIIQKTTNAGEDWIDISPTTPMLSVYYKSIWFTDQHTGYIGCYLGSGGWHSRDPYCLKTFDGGATWEYETSVLMQSTYLPGIEDVFFIDEMRGWMVRGYKVYTTSEGISGDFGNSISLSEFLYSIHFINQNEGWVAGNNGLVAKTEDGGLSWNELSTGITDNLKSVYFVNSSNGWAVGYSNDNGIIIKSTDGGQAWHNTNFPSTKTLRYIHFINENIGWACGSVASSPSDKGVILYTVDGGDTWEVQHIENNCTVLYDMAFPNNNIGWAVGSDGILLKNTYVGVNDDTHFTRSLHIRPNPLKTSTILEYELSQPEKVTLTIYDHLGKQVYQTNENQPQGRQQIKWNAERFADGIYYYSLQVGDEIANGKMVKVR
jgi:photosystem II stability/assembly factor-like uncharacterized protein